MISVNGAEAFVESTVARNHKEDRSAAHLVHNEVIIELVDNRMFIL